MFLNTSNRSPPGKNLDQGSKVLLQIGSQETALYSQVAKKVRNNWSIYCKLGTLCIITH